MISQLKVKTTIPKFLLEHCIGDVHVTQQTLWGYSFIIFISFTAEGGGGCILYVIIKTLNVRIIMLIYLFVRQKILFGLLNIRQRSSLYKGNVSYFLRQKCHWQMIHRFLGSVHF